ncbi:MAG: SHOCT domain-containing protein [Gammaproteobacteria bacterium]|nr:SHOCT domain-containing protein [Gammaproteobacteria bacterium]
MGGNTGSMFFGGGFMWIFWILVIIAIFMIFKSFMGSNSDSGSDSPLEILKKRFARGEINEEEFERKRKELE